MAKLVDWQWIIEIQENDVNLVQWNVLKGFLKGNNIKYKERRVLVRKRNK